MTASMSSSLQLVKAGKLRGLAVTGLQRHPALPDLPAVAETLPGAAIRMHTLRLMLLDAAAKQEQGQDVRTEAAMIKIYATEMATDIIDQAMQTLGAMGVTKELPLHLMAQKVRVMRVYEGPAEVHWMVIARKVLRDAS
jgi:acyl-CoA dehydrogenase